MTIVFDTETKGKADFKLPAIHESQPRLVQLGALLLDEELQTVGELNLIIKPVGFQIPPAASAVHGITQEHAEKYGVSEHAALLLFREWCLMSERIVAHNIAFDVLVMGRAFFVHQLECPSPEPFCTMKAAAPICKLPGFRGEYKWPSLQEAHKIIIGSEFEGAHDAMADVRACARIYERLIHGDRPAKAPLDTDTPPPVYDETTPMPFGKYRNTPLGKLPDSYVDWLCTLTDLKDQALYNWLHHK